MTRTQTRLTISDKPRAHNSSINDYTMSIFTLVLREQQHGRVYPECIVIIELSGRVELQANTLTHHMAYIPNIICSEYKICVIPKHKTKKIL